MFTKGRLKFVMMEDALQYGTQDRFKNMFYLTGKYYPTFKVAF